MLRKITMLIVACVLVVAVCSCRKREAKPQAPGARPAKSKLIIAVIPKGTTHVFWKSVEAGAVQAGNELGVEIRWKGPIKENDRAQQIQIVQQFVSEGVDGIVLAPLDDEALQAPCRAAMDKGIPVVIFDSALKGALGKDYLSFVATDNRKGGMLGGEEMVYLLAKSGRAALLRYQVGSASTTERENGFLDTIAKSPAIEVIVSNRYGEATVGEAMQTCENMIDILRQANGVFTPNESTTVAMYNTLQRHGLAGRVRFVGFDASETLVTALKDGAIDALVVQNPTKMGYLGVKTVVAHIRGEKIEPRIDTGVAVVTRKNMNDPEIAELIKIR